jgi:DNA-binding MarR family transcriptional regulator
MAYYAAMKQVDLSPDSVDPSTWTVPDLFIRFVRAIFELNRGDLKHKGLPSSQQIRALLYLVQHDGTTIKSLAQALGVSEARASRLAEELAEAGHVLHERDLVDRRQVRLCVAPASAVKARAMYAERMGALRSALAGASEAELAVFEYYLRRVVEEFEALAMQVTEPSVSI